MKLEVGKTYLTPSGEQIKISYVQTLSGTYRLFRRRLGSTEYWFENGGYSSGADSMKLIMEMPETVKKGVLKLEIDLDTLVVTVVK